MLLACCWLALSICLPPHLLSTCPLRTARFPPKIVKACLNMKMHEGETTVPRDLQRILNLCAERPLDLPPLKFTWQYMRANAAARARLIPRLLRPALAVGGDAYQALLDVLHASRFASFEASFVRTTPYGPVTGFTPESCLQLLKQLPAALTTLIIALPIERLPREYAPCASRLQTMWPRSDQHSPNSHAQKLLCAALALTLCQHARGTQV